MARMKVARLTGLEPATPGVTGRYSNQLSYNRAFQTLQYSVTCGISKAPPPVKCPNHGWCNFLNFSAQLPINALK